ncbi:Phosphatases II [Mycena venus]|uniref:Phosphatases II n=1 Tax=Mycena venus TaxID=2733690 RepID=A0A8H7DFH8_9AGAR|nr:Phosphatases II [Mycena venus]
MPADRPSELHLRPHPIPNSYWATSHLFACEYPWDPRTPSKLKLDTLLNAGVRTFVDLTEERELSPYAAQILERASLLWIDEKEIEYHRFPIHDRCCPESLQFMRRILDVLRDNEERNRITAVHCRGSIGRTGTVVGCVHFRWYAVECGLAKDSVEALEIIASEWHGVAKCARYPQSPETGPQCNFALNFYARSPREQIAF